MWIHRTRQRELFRKQFALTFLIGVLLPARTGPIREKSTVLHCARRIVKIDMCEWALRLEYRLSRGVPYRILARGISYPPVSVANRFRGKSHIPDVFVAMALGALPHSEHRHTPVRCDLCKYFFRWMPRGKSNRFYMSPQCGTESASTLRLAVLFSCAQ